MGKTGDKSLKLKSIIFKVIIIIWMLNIVLSIFDDNLELYQKFITQFYNDIYSPFYAKAFRFLLFIIGWICILFYSLKNRKKSFKGYNIILISIIIITILSIGNVLNYYRDYESIKNDLCIQETISCDDIHTINIGGRNYLPTIKTKDGNTLLISSKNYNDICIKLQIKNIDSKVSSSTNTDDVNIYYLQYTKTVLKIE